METKFKPHIVPIISIITSLILGLIFDDYIFGTITLLFGFLNSYYAAIGKWQNYIYSIGFNFFYAYICALNGLYGFLIFTLIIYIPLQLYGLINWIKNNHHTENIIEMKSLSIKKSIPLCLIVIGLSAMLGLLLNLIPTQNLAFMDSTSQIINIAGLIALSLRYREAWYIWLVNNTIDLVIWIINVVNKTQNSPMMLITNIVYLVMNIIAIICWIKLENKQKNKKI